MDSRSKHSGGDRDYSGENPIYSRLFVVCDKKTLPEDIRSAFSRFGHIEDIKMPSDSRGESKGLCFIKFAKTSSAADAIEAMDQKCLPNSQRSLKVMVAVNRSEVERNDTDLEKYKRLFIHVPKNASEKELEEIFDQYGQLSSIMIQRNHYTGDSKGFAYVNYFKFSEAARAFEQCGKQYRAVFAKPRVQNRPETTFESNIGLLARSAPTTSSLISMMGGSYNQGGFTKVNYLCCPQVTHNQIGRLFDLVPGMIDCKFFVDLASNCGKGTISYSNPNSAAYAVEKLNEFEYPPGTFIYVKPNYSYCGPQQNDFRNIPRAVHKLNNAIMAASINRTPDLAQLAEAIAEASKLVKNATGDFSNDNVPHSSDLNYCSVKLPPPQPLADIDCNVVKRCFLVCKPAPPPLTVLRDIFCRFGDLINVYTLPNKTVGYARYASVGSADKAIKTLHGAEVCGVRMKVLEADAEAPPRKRRYDDNGDQN